MSICTQMKNTHMVGWPIAAWFQDVRLQMNLTLPRIFILVSMVSPCRDKSFILYSLGCLTTMSTYLITLPEQIEAGGTFSYTHYQIQNTPLFGSIFFFHIFIASTKSQSPVLPVPETVTSSMIYFCGFPYLWQHSFFLLTKLFQLHMNTLWILTFYIALPWSTFYFFIILFLSSSS